MASLKRAPGVTSLCCLVGGTWTSERRVVVVEADPSGGDLAARFGLSSRRGRSSFTAAARRAATAEIVEIVDEHVQTLPGGLEILTGSAIDGRGVDAGPLADATSRALRGLGDELDVIVDLGRLCSYAFVQQRILAVAERMVVLVEPDTASVLHARDWWARGSRQVSLHDGTGQLRGDREPGAVHMRERGGHVGLVIVGKGERSPKEIETYVGLPVIANVPRDPNAAAVVCGTSGTVRRLRRSSLVSAARRLAVTLQDAPGELGRVQTDDPDIPDVVDGQTSPSSDDGTDVMDSSPEARSGATGSEGARR